MTKVRRVAVLGAGMTGVIAALELAEAGIDVDLYEARDEPMLGASFANEGKIHLGFVYAGDDSRESAAAMIRGASTFESIVGRYVPQTELDASRSRPFVYAVPRDSLLPLAGIRQHFAEVCALLEMQQRPITRAEGDVPCRELDVDTFNSTFDDGLIQAAFQTVEVSLDPWVIAPWLRAAVSAHARITILTRCPVHRISTDAMTVLITSANGTSRYDRVINATWEQRLQLDATAGLTQNRPTLHRYKLGVNGAVLPTSVPSVTFVLGLFGDVVSYSDRSYQSWYLSGMVASTSDVAPPGVEQILAGLDLEQIARESAENIGAFMPNSAAALMTAATGARVEGGWITAWGKTGIDDLESELHERHRIGATQYGPLISVDSGKYTTAPAFGVQAATMALRSL